jgi:RNA polymerase sigma-70 factor (ECF subfamily)
MRAHAEAVLLDTAPALLGYFVNRIDSPDDAADLLAQVLLEGWKSRSRMPVDPGEARMWLFGVARNVMSTRARSSRRRERLTAKLAEALAAAQAGDAISHEDAAEVRAAIRSLPEGERTLVVLVHWDGLSLVEASGLLGIPASTARGRYQSARKRLALQLGSQQGQVERTSVD